MPRPPLDEDGEDDVVKLTEGKLRSAQLKTATVEQRRLRDVRSVPGRVQYNAAKHVALRTPTDGILTKVAVKPGDVVSQGQLLAVLSSPEIGTARADVLKRQAELSLAVRKNERQQQVHDNLQELFALLQANTDFEQAERAFEQRSLGEYREKLFSAYSKFRLAETLSEQVKPLAVQGAVPGKTVQTRASDRQIAEAAFRTACEQTAFEARQHRDEVQLAVEDARRRLLISQQHLQTLLGYEEHVSGNPDSPLSNLEVRAPFPGTIERCQCSQSDRVSHSDTLFVLADTTVLWIAADVRESDWPAVELSRTDELAVEIPAIPDRRFPARLHYVGREVSLESNSVPLVAIIDNRDGALRPGMFVRVSVPVGKPREVVAIPPQAVMQHAGEKFVFVAEGKRTYRKVDVALGQTDKNWVEVTAGPKAGQKIVADGAFLLKSELLLEGEKE